MASADAQIMVSRAKAALAKNRDVRLTIAGWRGPVSIRTMDFEGGAVIVVATNGMEYVINPDAIQALVIYQQPA